MSARFEAEVLVLGGVPECARSDIAIWSTLLKYRRTFQQAHLCAMKDIPGRLRQMMPQPLFAGSSPSTNCQKTTAEGPGRRKSQIRICAYLRSPVNFDDAASPEKV